jgi:nicotinic acid mononucleotide adenylyltransferase
MKNVREINKLHGYILSNLLKEEILKKIKIDKEEMQGLLSNMSFLDKISSDIRNKKHSCLDVYNLTIDILNEVCSELPKDWMKYVYEYILDKSFPNAVTIKLDEKYEKAALLYLNFLKTVFEYDEKVFEFDKFSKFELLTEEELENCNYPDEYNRFIHEFNENYVFLLMRLSKEITEHNTIDHIAGVHYVAMHIARQLNKVDVPINISVVSAAAIGHDIGKYGCRKIEQHRVAYLHYYYTDQWFRKIDAPLIAHIATNHSTWDLELENLPVEELILIYADFRVKNNSRTEKYEMDIFTLDESFNIILDKLDNVDELKEKRYKKVYNKLKDFENYMHSLGINTDFSSFTPARVNQKNFSLAQGKDIINNLKFMSIKHNILLMNKLSHDVSLSSMIEAARSESDWNSIRYYMNIFEEYSTYLTQGQKLLTLNFLYELFINRQSDIRKKSAQLLGMIITSFDEDYRKEIPEDVLLEVEDINSLYLWDKYLNMIISPDHKNTLQQKQWISGTLDTFLESVFQSCKESEKRDYVQVLMKYYQNEELTTFELIQAGLFIPMDFCSNDDIDQLLKFATRNTESDDEPTALASFILIEHILKGTERDIDLTNVIKLIKMVNEDDKYFINFIKLRITALLELEKGYKETYNTLNKMEKGKIQGIFLDNLKTATHWIVKSVSIDFISSNATNLDMVSLLQAATHFGNLIKVSANATVRYKAGVALLNISKLLPKEHINEISIELLKGLEIDSFEFSKYIPEYLGQFVLLLDPAELNEIIDEVQNIFSVSMSSTSCLCLDTIGFIINHYEKYKYMFNENELVYNKRLVKMLGIIFSGLASFDEQIKQEAFLVVGKILFGSKHIKNEQKIQMFNIISKKLLTLIPTKKSTDISFYHNAASLNHIYRFISDYILENGSFEFEDISKVAFFPGTFDPFSLSHKGIVQEIRNLGYEVYLAVDEFSWSKRTQPILIRRQITNMSIADEFGIYLFPDDIPINISNSNDLSNLKSIFSGKDVFIVVGSDVIDNASAYKNEPDLNSIHNFNHIVFNRLSREDELEDHDERGSDLGRINAEVVRLTLPIYLEDISSTQIRDNIDDNRDISYLIDSSAQNFIYEKGLYLREPQYKSIIKTKSLGLYIDETLDEEIKALINENIDIDKINADELFLKAIKTLKIMNEEDNKIVGFSVFHNLSTSLLYDEFGSVKLANYVREHTAGNIVVIDGLYIDEKYKAEDIIQIILTETFAHCLENDFTYVLFHNVLNIKYEKNVYDTLELQGFKDLQNDNSKGCVYGVDMKFPLALVLDVESFIKEPLSSNEKVMEIVVESRKKLQKSLVQLYPDSLILSFDNEIIQHKIVKKICELNSVPNRILKRRVLGEYMCVPFGATLNGRMVPNTVTKSIHTDKVFNAEISNFTIAEYPFYSPLLNQVKTIKSFKRPVILVDDILNKGYRMKVIDPMFKSNDIKVKKTIVGILSSRGKDLMTMQNREIDCAYFIPNLRLWFNENLMYPFIGGDTVGYGEEPILNLIPSINLILPYVEPKFIRGADHNSVFELSMTCLENAKNIMQTLETEYQRIYERKLTLKRLSEVMVSPRVPDRGKDISYDLNVEPSRYIENDINLLMRLKKSK